MSPPELKSCLKKKMQNINAIVMTTLARSPDLTRIENIFAEVSMILQNQEVDQNITKGTFSEFSARVRYFDQI